MKIEYTYWKDNDFFIGFINQYPDYETQGETLEELKENLRDLWQDLAADMIPYTRCSSFSIPLPSNSYLHPAEQYFNDAVGPKRPKSLPIICFPDGIS
ncbi:hypothetical protein BMR06_11625 [Methylococcaceae bacterium HT5]|nr:hypothetical protein BMR06_11625 [Methylococcaceae bacterium HT5]